MKLIALFALYLAISPAQQTGAATTRGACSPANTGNSNTFNITCGIGKEQGAEMLKILNTILTNQISPVDVMAKLDEILRAVNPNLPVKTYFCNGVWKTAGPSATAAMSVAMGGDDKLFQEMINLNNSKEYANLLKVCLKSNSVQPRVANAAPVLRDGLFRDGRYRKGEGHAERV